MIQHLDNWLAQFRTPFWEAIYLDNHTQCQASLDQAQRALGNMDFSDDELDALRAYVHFMRYQLKHYFAPRRLTGRISPAGRSSASAWRSMARWRGSCRPVAA